MTPLEISIVLHYYYSGEDFRGGDFSPPAVRDTIDRFRDSESLLQNAVDGMRTYRLTERGERYVEHLMAQPLPVCRWVIPGAASGAGERTP